MLKIGRNSRDINWNIGQSSSISISPGQSYSKEQILLIISALLL